MTENSSSALSRDKFQDISYGIGAFILSVSILLGVPGNLFIIWSILARARKRSVTTLLILHLACADGALMCLTIFFVVYLAKQSWVFGWVMCKLLFYLCNTNMYASIMLITVMSIYRLVAVRWPLYVYTLRRRRTVQAGLSALWVVVFILAVPALIFREELEEKNLRLCRLNHVQPRYAVLQFTTETFVGFLLPYGIIVGSYVCILRRLKRSRFKRKIRSEKLILAIVAAFAIFWLPYHIINIIQVVSMYMPENELQERLSKISKNSRPATSAFAFISSCANPVLYTFAGRAYIKTEGLSFLARLFERTAPDITARNVTEHRDRNALGLKTSDSQDQDKAAQIPDTTAQVLASTVALAR